MQTSHDPQVPAVETAPQLSAELRDSYYQQFNEEALKIHPQLLTRENIFSNLETIKKLRGLFKLLQTGNYPDFADIKTLYLFCTKIWLQQTAVYLLAKGDLSEIADPTLEYIVDVSKELFGWDDDKAYYLEWGQMLHAISCYFVVRPNPTNTANVLTITQLTLGFYEASVVNSIEELDDLHLLNFGVALSYFLHATCLLKNKTAHIAALDKTLSLIDTIDAKKLTIDVGGGDEFLSYWLIKMMLDTIDNIKYSAEEQNAFFLLDRVTKVLSKCQTLHKDFYNFHYEKSCRKFPILKDTQLVMDAMLKVVGERKSKPLTPELLVEAEKKEAQRRNQTQPAKVLVPAPTPLPALPPQTEENKLFLTLLQCGKLNKDGSFMVSTDILYERFFKSSARVANLPPQMYFRKEQFKVLSAKPKNIKEVLEQMIADNFTPKPAVTKRKKKRASTPSVTKSAIFNFSPAVSTDKKSREEKAENLIPSDTLKRSSSAQTPASSPVSATSTTSSMAPASPISAPSTPRSGLSIFAKPKVPLNLKTSNIFSELAEEEEDEDNNLISLQKEKAEDVRVMPDLRIKTSTPDSDEAELILLAEPVSSDTLSDTKPTQQEADVEEKPEPDSNPAEPATETLSQPLPPVAVKAQVSPIVILSSQAKMMRPWSIFSDDNPLTRFLDQRDGLNEVSPSKITAPSLS